MSVVTASADVLVLLHRARVEADALARFWEDTAPCSADRARDVAELVRRTIDLLDPRAANGGDADARP